LLSQQTNWRLDKMNLNKKMKWLTGTTGISVILLFTGCSSQPLYYSSPFGSPGGVVPCDTFCVIKKECEAKAKTSNLAEYNQWLDDMSQGFFNYRLICADVTPPAK